MTEKQFHNRYLTLSDALYKMAYYLLESQQEAEDTVQELFLKLWKGRDALDDIRNPRAYAMTLLRNLCLDRIRQASRLSGTPVKEEDPGSVDPDRQMDEKERLEKVLAAVKSLPDRQREVLTLRTIEGLSYEEIAGRTGLRPLTLRVLLSQARAQLKKQL